MIKKCFSYLKGFMRLSTIIILLILGVSIYIWHAKLQEIATDYYSANKDKGSLLYARGIWQKMKGVQNVQDEKTQIAMELTERTKVVSEKNGHYSIAIPESWNITIAQGVLGKQISKMVFESESYSQFIDETGIYYNSGVQMTIEIIKGEMQDAKSFDGSHGSELVKKGNVEIDGQGAEYHLLKEVNVKKGGSVDAHVLRDGNTYYFRLVFGPGISNSAEFSFQEMLASFKFGENK